MVSAKKLLIIFVVAILFSILVFTTIDAAYPSPEYNNYCNDTYRSLEYPKTPGQTTDCDSLVVLDDDWQSCLEKEGTIQYHYSSSGCADSYECNTCQNEFNNAREVHSFVMFIISAILGLIAIMAGMYLPTKSNPLNEWVGTGFMFGGLISIFFGTAIYFGDLHRIWRPIVILFELVLVLWLAYKKLGGENSGHTTIPRKK